jgi:glutathione peroxidase
VYRALTSAIGGDVRWNFTKFLVDQKGEVAARFEPDVEPLDKRVTGAIEKLLAAR